MYNGFKHYVHWWRQRVNSEKSWTRGHFLCCLQYSFSLFCLPTWWRSPACTPSPVPQFLTWPQTAGAVSWAVALAGCPLTHLSMSVLVSMFRHSSIIFTPVKVYFHRISLPLLFLEGHIFLLCDQRNFWLSQRLEVVLLINKSIALLEE